jgi:hypothetical protein
LRGSAPAEINSGSISVSTNRRFGMPFVAILICSAF